MNSNYDRLRREYLKLCDMENCAGDLSVGIFPCPFYDGGCTLEKKAQEDEQNPASGLNALAAAVHEVAVAHGWWEDSPHHTPPSFPEVIALCHSELSEALEAYRSGEDPQVINYTFEGCGELAKDACAGCFGGNPKCGIAKPDGVPVELADCIIRILDYCAFAGIDIEGAVARKHEHNKTRSYRHGGKRI